MVFRLSQNQVPFRQALPFKQVAMFWQSLLPWRALSCALFMGGLILITTGCQSSVWSQTSTQTSAQAPITIERIQAIESSGEYTIQGQAQVPDNTLIAVSAMQTEPGNQYRILDRQRVYVQNRLWQSKLNLVKALAQSPSLSQAANSNESSSSLPGGKKDVDVTILATLDPALQSQALTKKLSRQTQNYEKGNIRLNDEGELYAVASKTLKIALTAIASGSGTQPESAPASPRIVSPTQTIEAQAVEAQAAKDSQKETSKLPLPPTAFFN
jgi:hypothetical protein